MKKRNKVIIASIVAISLSAGAAILVSASPKKLFQQDKKITLTLSTQEVETILGALQELPMKISGGVYANVYTQANQQLQDQQQKPKVDSSKKKQ